MIPEKIIVIVHITPTIHDHNRFGIATFEQKGIPAEMWDISSESRSEIKNKIAHLKKGALVIVAIWFDHRTFWLFKTLSNRGIPYCVFGGLTIPLINIPPLQQIISAKPTDIFWHLIDRHLSAYYHQYGIKDALAELVISGEKGMGVRQTVSGGSTKRLQMHSFDYDSYISNPSEFHDKNTIGVFLEEGIITHPDYTTFGIDSPATTGKYYPSINKCINSFEKNGIKIKIAAHPRSDEGDLSFWFKKPVIKWQTAELVRKSSFVITHASTATNLAVLYNKPVIFITTDEIEKMRSGKNPVALRIQAIANALGKVPVNIDHEYPDLEREMRVDYERYRTYENEYIHKQDSPRKPMWETFIESMNEVNI